MLAALFTVFLISSCIHQPPVLSPEELTSDYRSAILDAKVAEPNEISRVLTAITADNPDLVWQGTPGTSRVLVVTWTDFEGYKEKIGQSIETPVLCWVTIVPELQAFCQKQKPAPKALTLRLKQLLGLPPESNKSLFVEMWVDPRDLFRPSPDPEITDHEAELDFPGSDRFVKVSIAHIQWFKELKSRSYSKNGYPWTRLGYTYDWGNPENETGLSEFIIRKGADIRIKSVSTLGEYCQ
jgi:hypothetical protein